MVGRAGCSPAAAPARGAAPRAASTTVSSSSRTRLSSRLRPSRVARRDAVKAASASSTLARARRTSLGGRRRGRVRGRQRGQHRLRRLGGRPLGPPPGALLLAQRLGHRRRLGGRRGQLGLQRGQLARVPGPLAPPAPPRAGPPPTACASLPAWALARSASAGRSGDQRGPARRTAADTPPPPRRPGRPRAAAHRRPAPRPGRALLASRAATRCRKVTSSASHGGRATGGVGARPWYAGAGAPSERNRSSEARHLVLGRQCARGLSAAAKVDDPAPDGVGQRPVPVTGSGRPVDAGRVGHQLDRADAVAPAAAHALDRLLEHLALLDRRLPARSTCRNSRTRDRRVTSKRVRLPHRVQRQRVAPVGTGGARHASRAYLLHAPTYQSATRGSARTHRRTRSSGRPHDEDGDTDPSQGGTPCLSRDEPARLGRLRCSAWERSSSAVASPAWRRHVDGVEPPRGAGDRWASRSTTTPTSTRSSARTRRQGQPDRELDPVRGAGRRPELLPVGHRRALQHQHRQRRRRQAGHHLPWKFRTPGRRRTRTASPATAPSSTTTARSRRSRTRTCCSGRPTT